MQGFEEHELTEKQHATLRRAFARYASLNFARGIIQQPRPKEITALQDTILARELEKVCPTCTTALNKVGKDECGVVVIRNLPLGLNPPTELRDETPEQRSHRLNWPGKNPETNEDMPKFNLAPIALAALGGAVGKETIEQRSAPRTTVNGVVKADEKHTDRQPYTVLLCTRGSYVSGKQMESEGFKKNPDQYKAITKFYLLKDLLKDDRLSQKNHIDILSEARFKSTRDGTDNPKVGPILLKQPDGGYKVNHEIFSMTSYTAVHDANDTKASEALAVFNNVIATSAPSHSIELKRGDAVAFGGPLVVTHERPLYRTHEDPTEAREIIFKSCSPNNLPKFPEDRIQKLMAQYAEPPSHTP